MSWIEQLVANAQQQKKGLPKTRALLDPDNVLLALQGLGEMGQLSDDVLASLLEAANRGVRGDKTAIVDLFANLRQVARQLPTYAPGGAKPTEAATWTDVARAAGYSDPETTGIFLQLLAPNLPVKKLSKAGGIIDTRKGGAERYLFENNQRMYDDLRRRRNALYAEAKEIEKRMMGLDYMSPERLKLSKELENINIRINQINNEVFPYGWTQDLHKEGKLVVMRTGEATGLGNEGLSGAVFSTVSPQMAEVYRRHLRNPFGGNKASNVVGWRIPKEARIVWDSERTRFALDEDWDKWVKEGYDVIQRGDEFILTPNFFKRFGNKPEVVRR